jgi:hypothetical protein
MNDPADHAVIIHPMGTTSTAWQQWLNPPPSPIAEPVDLL